MREMRDLCAYSCLGCAAMVSEREMHARTYGPPVYGRKQPIIVYAMPPERYLRHLIAAQGPIIHPRTP